MIKIRLIARNKDDISIAAIDFFSFGHLLAGYFAFLTLFSIFFVNYGISTLFIYLVGNLLISVIWELIENFWLYKINIKFAHRRDSVINSITDILFFILGGVISWIIIFFYRYFLLIISIAMIYLVAITGYFWSKYALK